MIQRRLISCSIARSPDPLTPSSKSTGGRGPRAGQPRRERAILPAQPAAGDLCAGNGREAKEGVEGEVKHNCKINPACLARDGSGARKRRGLVHAPVVPQLVSSLSFLFLLLVLLFFFFWKCFAIRKIADGHLCKRNMIRHSSDRLLLFCFATIATRHDLKERRGQARRIW